MKEAHDVLKNAWSKLPPVGGGVVKWDVAQAESVAGAISLLAAAHAGHVDALHDQVVRLRQLNAIMLELREMVIAKESSADANAD